jgi:hypothetical protein
LISGGYGEDFFDKQRSEIIEEFRSATKASLPNKILNAMAGEITFELLRKKNEGHPSLMHVHCNGGASGHVMNFYLTAGKIIHNVF